MLVGVAMVSIPPEQSQSLVELSGAVQQLTMRVVGWAMLLAPYAVFGLLARLMIEVGTDALRGMATYVATVLLGLGILLVVYVTLVMLLTGRGPRSFLGAIRDPLLVAFSTSSSAAAMPLSMEAAERGLGVPPEIARFVVPLGATVNMAGTALYQVVATLFLAQVFGIDLTPGELALLTATVVGASIGSPSTPGVGIAMLATILQGAGVPASGIALVIGVDRVLDMARTTLNVTGDLAACVVIDRWMPAAAPQPVADAGPPSDE